MKLLKSLALAGTLVASLSANASILTFQGSSDSSSALSLAAARAAWEAELFSFTIDDMSGATGVGATGITTTAGNTYQNTGNGSSINVSTTSVLGAAPAIRGLRSGAALINFDVFFQSPVNAVGFDVYDNDGGGMSLTLTNAVTGVETLFNFQSSPGSGDREFFGVVFDPTVFVSSLEVGGTDPGGVTTWDNFTFGIGQQAQNIIDNATPASAPSAALLLGLALAGLSVRARKRG